MTRHIYKNILFFSRCRQVPFYTGTWNFDRLDTRFHDRKRFPPKTGFRYAQGPFKTDLLWFFYFCFRSVTSHNMLLNGYYVHAIVQIQHCCWTQIHGSAHGWVVCSVARGRIIRLAAGNERCPSYRKIRKWRKRICNNNTHQSLELVFSICGKCLTKSKGKYPALFLYNTVPLAQIYLRERVSVCSM